jgi:hypothetical protein
MPAAGFIDFRCPVCGQAVRLPAGAAGQEATCPACRAEVPVPGASDAPPPLGLFWGGDLPAPQPAPEPHVLREEDLPAWNLVAGGLRLESLAALLLLGAAGVLFALGCLAQDALGATRRGPRPPTPLLPWGLGLIVLGAFALGLLGRCLLCFTPAVARARGFALGSLLLVLAAGAAFVAALVLSEPEAQAAALRETLGIFGLIAVLLGHALFLLFLAAVTLHLRDPLGRRLAVYFGCTLALPALVVGVFALLRAVVAESAPEGSAFVNFLWLSTLAAVVLGLLVWHRRLVGQVREDVQQHLRWSGPPGQG